MKEGRVERILITGGNGNLGRALVAQLSHNPDTVLRVMSRHPRPPGMAPGLEWAQADLESGAGINWALEGVHTVIHAASSPARHTRQVDEQGTRRLVEQARQAGVSHLVYISIVGVDRIPFPYYQAKLAAESIVENSGVPWSILRATQFHYLLALALRLLTRLPIVPWPMDIPDQPVGIEEVAQALSHSVAAGPAGRLPDMGGPEVLTGREVIRTFLEARRLRRVVLPLHLPGKAADGFRKGYHTCPQNRQGRLTWREWLAANT